MFHDQVDSGLRRAVIPVLLLLVVSLGVMLTACQRATPGNEEAQPASAPSIASDPRDGTEEVGATTPLRIAFPAPMDRAAVERGLSIEPKPDGSIAWEADTLIFSPSPGWQMDTRYRVALTIPSKDGKSGGTWQTSFATVSLPRVIRYTPETAAPSRTDSAITFEFNRSIDDASFLQHFSVSPDVTGKLIHDGKLVSFVPREPLLTGMKYSVTLRAGVRDERGLETSKATQFQFSTMESPRVVSVTPGMNGTATGNTIVVEFDRPMNRSSVESAFSIYPPARGTMSWQGNKLVFTSDGLSPGTQYTIGITPGAVRDLDENYLLEPLRSDFAAAGQTAVVSLPRSSPTTAPRVSSASLTPTSGNVASAARGPEPSAPAPALAAMPPATSTPTPRATSTPVPPATPPTPIPATPVPPTPIPPATATPQPTATSAPVTVADLLATLEYEVLIAHNAVRKAAGLGTLTLDPRLIDIARYRSADMARRGYFSHTSPDGSTAFTIMDGRGIRYVWAGENLALNDAKGDQSVEVAMTGWMNSEGHRANILNPKFDYVGIGMATNTKGVNYFTVVFLASSR